MSRHSPLNRALRWGWIHYWVIVVMWRVVAGRWFAFQDAPLLIVRLFSMLRRTAEADASYDEYPAAAQFVAAACDELAIRRLRRRREIAR